MKKWIKITLAVLAALILSLTLSGCRKIEVAERAFVEAIGLDRNDGELTVTLQLLKSEEKAPEPYILSGKGGNFTEAFDEAERGQVKKLFLGHCKVIILGEGIADTRAELEYFLNSNRISPGVRLALADGKAADLVIGADLQKLLEQSTERGETVSTNLVQLLGQSGGTLLPVLSIEENQITAKICGLVVNGIREGVLSEEESKGAAILSGEIKSVPLSFSNGGAVTIMRVSAEFSTKTQGEKIGLVVTLKVDGRAEEGLHGVSKAEIERSVGRELKKLCTSTLKKSSETGTDFLLLKWKMGRYSAVSEGEFQHFLENTEPDTIVECNIEPQRKF